MDIDPAKKQYMMFAAIVTLILSAALNFFFFDLLQNSFFFGFPISLDGASGITEVFIRLANTLILFLLMVVPVYLSIMWALRKMSGGGEY